MKNNLFCNLRARYYLNINHVFSWLFFRVRFKILGLSSLKYENDVSIITVPMVSNLPFKRLYGWYMLEVDYDCQTSSITSSLVAHSSAGDSCIELPDYKGRTIKRVCYFSEPSSVCWSGDGKGLMNLKPKFSFKKLSSRFAVSRIHKKYISKAISLPKGLSNLELYGLYDALFVSHTSKQSYDHWQRSIEPFLWSPAIKSESYHYKFSIVIPVYNTPSRYLEICIRSVMSQSYTNWELLIADDYSTNIEVKAVLESLAKEDSRIKILFRGSNGHISAATNTALAEATGDYVALLDHDDVLSPHALNEVALSIDDNPSLKLIYSDEDKISTEEKRYGPFFKPGFSPELLLSQNYICHFLVIKRSLLEQVGGMRVGYEGSQDHDLLLRLLPQLNLFCVKHIPKILYHWRAIDGSTAQASDEKSYSWKAGVHAVQDYLDSNLQGYTASAGLQPNTYNISSEVVGDSFVSVIIPTRNRLDLLKPCIESLLNFTSYENYEVIVLDNDSDDDDTLSFLASINLSEKVRVIKVPGEFNFSKINNIGVEQAKGELVCLMNNDIEIIEHDWMKAMVEQALRPNIGCVGAKLLYPNNTLQHGGVILGLGGVAGHSHSGLPDTESGYFDRMAIVHNTSAVTAACLMVKKEIYNLVGGLDEGLPVAFNDIDFCIKVTQKGFRNLWTPYAKLYHYESASRGYEETPEKKARFKYESDFMKQRWGVLLSMDPFYNVNFDLNSHSYQIKPGL